MKGKTYHYGLWAVLCLFGCIAAIIVAAVDTGPTYPIKVDAHSNVPTSLLLYKGGTLWIKIIGVGQTIGGDLWRTDSGLRVVIDSTGASAPMTNLNEKQWGSELDGSCFTANPTTPCPKVTDDIEIEGTLKMPQLSGPETQTVQAHIQGDITYPVDTGGGYFENKTSSISVPLQLQLIPQAQYEQNEVQHTIIGLAAMLVELISFLLGALFLAAWLKHKKLSKSKKSPLHF